MPSPGPSATQLGAAHRRRLRDVWRSAGWPCQDMVEAELLAAGWLERQRDALGRESVRVTELGVQQLAQTLQRNRAARDDHEALVERVATDMQRMGRIVWRGLSLRAPVAHVDDPQRVDWVMAMPDVFSIRHTTVQDYAEPVAHEIKVRRADLLADVRRPRKREAYLALSSQCWYVLGPGVGTQDDVPAECGVLQAPAGGGALELLRPAPRRAMQIGFATWMALARANAVPPLEGDEQALL